MTKMMRAARLHEVGQPMVIENMPVPSPRPTDVLVKVKACAIVPNLANVLNNWHKWNPQLPLPKLPAIFGLDPAGIIEEVGSQVHAFKPGDSVYVNPARYCGGCRACRLGDTTACPFFTYSGYFGFSERSHVIWNDYPYGGLSEYMTAPQYSLVKLPENLSFETAARFGYLGTAYRALCKAQVGPTSTILVNGITGTLGIGVALYGLALGARKILGTARNREPLQRVKALAPRRVEVMSLDDGPVAPWVAEVTNGEGVNAVIDAVGPGAPSDARLESLKTLGRGGQLINIGDVGGDVPMNLFHMMAKEHGFTGSVWFTTAQGQEMADMVESGVVDLSVFEHSIHKLEDVNAAISGIKHRNGGFSNFVICP
jgi:alcohol dehydrogenase